MNIVSRGLKVTAQANAVRPTSTEGIFVVWFWFCLCVWAGHCRCKADVWPWSCEDWSKTAIKDLVIVESACHHEIMDQFHRHMEKKLLAERQEGIGLCIVLTKLLIASEHLFKSQNWYGPAPELEPTADTPIELCNCELIQETSVFWSRPPKPAPLAISAAESSSAKKSLASRFCRQTFFTKNRKKNTSFAYLLNRIVFFQSGSGWCIRTRSKCLCMLNLFNLLQLQDGWKISEKGNVHMST